MVIPVVRRLHSPDVDDLPSHCPEISDKFSLLLQIMVGPSDSEGEESFDVTVCTPRWISDELLNQGVLIGRHYLIVREYDYQSLERFIERYGAKCSADTWDGVAERLGRLGLWEFEDYQP